MNRAIATLAVVTTIEFRRYEPKARPENRLR